MHIARAQSAGRGRLGRRWESSTGEGLFLSVIVDPGARPPVALTMLTGLAVLGAVRRLGVSTARLDWPNDVVVGTAKLAGILVESRGLDAKEPRFVVGVGVNVLQREFSDELSQERAVTSLALEGATCGLQDAQDAMLEELGRRLDCTGETAPELGSEFLAGTELLSRRVRVTIGPETHTGELLGLTLGRGLCLRDSAGHSTHFALEHVRSVSVV